VLFLLLVLRALFRRDWLASVAFIAVFLTTPLLRPEDRWINVALVIGVWLIILLTLRKWGLTATVAVFFCTNSLSNGPARSDLAAWHTLGSTLYVVAAAAIACYGFSRALAGRPLLKGSLLEE